MFGRSLSRAAILVALTGCARAPDAAAARGALMDADRRFNNATAERRTDGWMDFIAEDGQMIRSAGTITGRAAIRDEMGKTFAEQSQYLFYVVAPENGGPYFASEADARRCAYVDRQVFVPVNFLESSGEPADHRGERQEPGRRGHGHNAEHECPGGAESVQALRRVPRVRRPGHWPGGGASCTPMSRTTIHDPSACFFQTVR